MAFNIQIMQQKRTGIILIAASLFLPVASAGTQVNVVGLFNSKAVVIINKGKPKKLSVGQVFDEVKLIKSNSLSAIF